MYHKNIIKQNIRDSARFTAIYILKIWDKTRIPTRLQKRVINKIEGLFKEWKKLKKIKKTKQNNRKG